MYITFYGAAGEVTGSSSLLEIGNRKILVDCGMFQGDALKEKKNHDVLPFDPTTLTDVIITHAHLDHVGRLPLLVKNGYAGHIYATPPTVELARLIMDDAMEIMAYNNRKMGTPILYDSTDVARTMEVFKPVDYESKVELYSSQINITFHEVGHIFGSAFVEIEGDNKRIVFSGDVGNINVPILCDTVDLPKNIDVLVCESTYGDRLHENLATRQELVEKMVLQAVRRGGVLLIPAFALERTQELIYDLNDLIDRKHKLPRVPIFLDSPLAIDTVKIYRKYPQYYDEEAQKYLKAGDDLFGFPGLTLTYTKEESKRINNVQGAKIIIAGAGMMNGGRVVHHALRYLSDERNTLLFVGYQTHGTLGRKIFDGESPVEILGERVAVCCQIRQIGALSAHGDQKKLMNWMMSASELPGRIFLNHGDLKASKPLAEKMKTEKNANIEVTVAGMRVKI